MILRRPRPGYLAPWLSKEEFFSFPKEIKVRLGRISIGCKGFRPKTKYIVTTVLDSNDVSSDDIAELYRRRWDAELDLRSIKAVLGMGVLRCKTPEMVRKEIWAHLTAYNALRVMMAQAAVRKAIHPNELSFRGTQQTLNGFGAAFRFTSAKRASKLYIEMLNVIGSQRVGRRPGRYEPRAIKRHAQNYLCLTLPRRLARLKKWKKQKGPYNRYQT